MTRASIVAQLAVAKSALAMGQCDRALAAVQLAWMDLGSYAQWLAAQGKSPSGAVKMHKKIVKAYAVIRRRCAGESLVVPSYRGRAMPAGLVQPTYQAHPLNPDLIAPSFSGPLVEGEPGNRPFIGIGLALAFIGVGLWGMSR